MSWPANSIRSLQTALKEGKCITTTPTVTFQPPVLCTQAFHNLEAAPSNLAAYSRCCFINLLSHFLSLAQESELPGTAAMDSPGAEKKSHSAVLQPPTWCHQLQRTPISLPWESGCAADPQRAFVEQKSSVEQPRLGQPCWTTQRHETVGTKTWECECQ